MLILVMDRPASPGNLGIILRAWDALQADGLIVGGHAADLYDPETIRAKTGPFFNVPGVRLPSYRELIPWLDGLKQRFYGLKVVGTSAKAKIPVHEHDFNKPTVLLMGNETNGLSDAYQALADTMITIPMYGYASSLNIASAASILLFEVAHQRVV